MNIAGKFIFISNRNVNPDKDGLDMFGEDFSPRGTEDLNLATAEFLETENRWKFELLTDPGGGDPDKPVSREIFHAIADLSVQQFDLQPWVLLIPGFNQSIEDNLRKCREIASFGANVMVFSWPSNPGPHEHFHRLQEYKRSRKNARLSVLALERLLEKVAAYKDELSFSGRHIGLILAVHSLGNYLVEHYVISSDFARETRVFDNILLNQPDVDVKNHTEWVERLSQDTRVYVTINESDRTLKESNRINGNRLGNTVRGLNAQGANYMDFTGGDGVWTSHRPWHEPGTDNAAVHAFFKAVFHGMRGEQVDGWAYDRGDNAYRLVKRWP